MSQEGGEVLLQNMPSGGAFGAPFITNAHTVRQPTNRALPLSAVPGQSASEMLANSRRLGTVEPFGLTISSQTSHLRKPALMFSSMSPKNRGQCCRTSVVLTLALVTLGACDRFKKAPPAELAVIQRQFDSATAVRDSILRRGRAEQESLFAMGDIKDVRGRVRPGPIEPMPLKGKISRAEELGDSIARARANELIQQTRTPIKMDTLRGEVRIEGSGPAGRPFLMTDKGRTKVALTGMGTDGLSQVVGSDVVVRGVLASPHDIVVSSFSVRSVNGIPAIDGRLFQPLTGGWAIELSDRSGPRKLTEVPQALQAFEGGRVWLAEEPGKGGAQLYGVISRR